MNKSIFFALLTTVVTACATPYQKQGFTGGFSETQLGENAFQITFKGNAYTSEERAADFTLLRSADLALENGYRYFIIVDSEQYAKLGAYTTPVKSHTTANAYGTGNYAYGTATTTTTAGQTYFFSKPRRNNTIVCFQEKPEVDGLVYDASFVSRSIRTKYQLSE